MTDMEFPKEFYPTDEANKFLLAFKKTLSKKLTLSRMNELFEEVRLGYYLHTLGRDDEAAVVAGFFPAQVKFDGNQNIWSPVAEAIYLAARLYRLGGKDSERAKVLTILQEHPAFAKVPRQWVSDKITKAKERIDQCFADTSKKWATQKLANELMDLCHWRETNDSGFPNSGFCDNDELEELFEYGKGKLKERIAF